MNPSLPQITEDYYKGLPQALQFFNLLPVHWDKAFRQRAEHPCLPWGKDDVAALVDWNQAVGADETALAAIGALGQGSVSMVMTGQQAGLMTSPLYCILKAAAAIKLARQLSRQHDHLVIPAFWIASEDHDFDEIRNVQWLGADGEVHRFNYEPSEEPEGQSVFDIPVEPSLQAILKQWEETTHPTEFRQEVLGFVEEALQGSKNLEELFARLLSRLFKGFGLVLVSPRLAPVRRRSLEILRREFDNPGKSTEILLKHNAAFEQQGYGSAIHRKPGDVNAFVYHRGLRCKVRLEHDRFHLVHPKTNEQLTYLTRENLLKMASETPERLSPNVVTRPVVQDAIFP
ncbi:MAG: bacillithiol biosynthesis cysteine-adding enzyme BshC, partial [bacterium]